MSRKGDPARYSLRSVCKDHGQCNCRTVAELPRRRSRRSRRSDSLNTSGGSGSEFTPSEISDVGSEFSSSGADHPHNFSLSFDTDTDNDSRGGISTFVNRRTQVLVTEEDHHFLRPYSVTTSKTPTLFNAIRSYHRKRLTIGGSSQSPSTSSSCNTQLIDVNALEDDDKEYSNSSEADEDKQERGKESSSGFGLRMSGHLTNFSNSTTNNNILHRSSTTTRSKTTMERGGRGMHFVTLGRSANGHTHSSTIHSARMTPRRTLEGEEVTKNKKRSSSFGWKVLRFIGFPIYFWLVQLVVVEKWFLKRRSSESVNSWEALPRRSQVISTSGELSGKTEEFTLRRRKAWTDNFDSAEEDFEDNVHKISRSREERDGLTVGQFCSRFLVILLLTGGLIGLGYLSVLNFQSHSRIEDEVEIENQVEIKQDRIDVHPEVEDRPGPEILCATRECPTSAPIECATRDCPTPPAPIKCVTRDCPTSAPIECATRDCSTPAPIVCPNPGVSVEEVEALIHRALSKYEADKTGRPDLEALINKALLKYDADKAELPDLEALINKALLKYDADKAELPDLEALINRALSKYDADKTGRPDLEALINKALLKYDADKTGRPDLALEPSGGSILSTRCTKSSKLRNSVVSLWGFKIWSPPNNPRTLIQPGVVPGECWAFEGSVGDVVIKLVAPSIVTGFTMEHISKSVSPYGTIDSAPYKFQVWGLNSEDDLETAHDYGTFSFLDNGEPLQYFQVENDSPYAYPIVELKILSNHGNLLHTCVYRFRVHGTMTLGGTEFTATVQVESPSSTSDEE